MTFIRSGKTKDYARRAGAKIIQLPLVVCLVSILLIFSADDISAKEARSHYTLQVHYNRIENSFTLTDPVSLSHLNFTHDDGSESQFYAQVIDIKGAKKTFKNGTTKFPLGKWRLIMFWDGIDENGKGTGGSKLLDEGDVRVSIPYFSDAPTLEIYRTKDDVLVMSIDVSEFSGRNYKGEFLHRLQNNENHQGLYISHPLFAKPEMIGFAGYSDLRNHQSIRFYFLEQGAPDNTISSVNDGRSSLIHMRDVTSEVSVRSMNNLCYVDGYSTKENAWRIGGYAGNQIDWKERASEFLLDDTLIATYKNYVMPISCIIVSHS
jgi:hypothetical protein